MNLNESKPILLIANLKKNKFQTGKITVGLEFSLNTD